MQGFESGSIKIDNAERFDEILRENRGDKLPECGDLEMVTKAGATVGGKSGVVITWTVDDGGKRRRVQCVTTVAVLASLAGALRVIADSEGIGLG